MFKLVLRRSEYCLLRVFSFGELDIMQQQLQLQLLPQQKVQIHSWKIGIEELERKRHPLHRYSIQLKS